MASKAKMNHCLLDHELWIHGFDKRMKEKGKYLSLLCSGVFSTGATGAIKVS